MLVYQHPSLVPHYDPPSPEQADQGLPKSLRSVALLRRIRQLGEKVLLFARSLNMQDLLEEGD